MTQAFHDMCLELVDEPEKLAKFIRLYYENEYIDPKKCKACNTLLPDYEHNYCDNICELLYEIFYHSSIKEFENWIQSFPTYNYKPIFTKISLDKISTEKKKILIQTSCQWVTHLASLQTTEYSDLLLEHASIHMFKYLYLWDESFVKRYLQTLGCKETILQLKESGDIVCLFDTKLYPLYQDIIQPYLNINDLQSYHKYPTIVQSLIFTFGKQMCQQLQPPPYTYITDTESFSLLYDQTELTDDMYWYFIKDYKDTPIFQYRIKVTNHSFYSNYQLQTYIFKDKNKLFQFLQRDLFQQANKQKYYKNLLQYPYSYFAEFIHKQSSELKPGDITLETLHTFFQQMGEMNDYFTYILQNMLNTFQLKDINLYTTTTDHLGTSYSYIDFILHEVYNRKRTYLLYQLQQLNISLPANKLITIIARASNDSSMDDYPTCKIILEQLDQSTFLELFDLFFKNIQYKQEMFDSIRTKYAHKF